MEGHGEYGVLRSRDLGELRSAMSLFPRQNGCVECDTNQQLTCPNECEAGKECVFEVGTDCRSCPVARCQEVEPEAGSSQPDDGPNAGAIAGGVIGGVLAVVVVTYLLWRFCVKPRRQQVPHTVYEAESDQRTVGEKTFSSRRDQRSSTHTVHSIASTVLTRASNIIQIAYIPGVTNRAQPPTSPTVLVPPVPPIPMAVSEGGSTPASPYEDQHFFMPGDLRDSTYSGLSGYSDRTSYARTSYAPRSSIASTIYGKNATVPGPAQTGQRARPMMVSVKTPQTPPVPPVPSDYDRFARPTSTMSRPKSSASAWSISSAFIGNATSREATQGRPQVVSVSSGTRTITVGQDAIDNGSAPPMPDLLTPTRSPARDQGPFSDPPEHDDVRSARSLSAIIEDAPRRTAKDKKKGSTEREASPFGDEHETRDQ